MINQRQKLLMISKSQGHNTLTVSSKLMLYDMFPQATCMCGNMQAVNLWKRDYIVIAVIELMDLMVPNTCIVHHLHCLSTHVQLK